MQLNDTQSSLVPTSKLQPYALGLTWGLQDIARGTYSPAVAEHHATACSADPSIAGTVLEGYRDAEDDTWDARSLGDGNYVHVMF